MQTPSEPIKVSAAIDPEKLRESVRSMTKEFFAKPKPNRAQRRAAARGKRVNHSGKSKAQQKREALAAAMKERNEARRG